jgi:cholesterol oxidase
LLRGRTGIRSFISSQVSIDTVPATLGKWKAGLHLDGVLDALGVDSLTAYTDANGGWKSKLFDTMLRFQPVGGDEHCESVTCHRGTFMYGLLWEHRQLNDATHGTLHEWMGVANIEVIEHLADMGRRGHVVFADGNESDLEHLDRLAFPITFLHGAENQVFVPDGSERTIRRLREANPDVRYTRHVLPGYGHLDPVMGANAVTDVYPLVLDHLEMVERERNAPTSGAV